MNHAVNSSDNRGGRIRGVLTPGIRSGARAARGAVRVPMPPSAPTAIAPGRDEPRDEPRDEGPDAFRLYLREIGQVPLLTRKEELALTRRARRGDTAARETLIKGNLRLVVKIARDYELMGMPLLDLIAEGNIGLMTAVDRYDPSRGAKLSVYASFWIKQCIRRALGNKSRTIRLPIHVHSQLVEIERTSRRLQELLGRAPTEQEIAQETRLPVAEVTRLRQARLVPTSLDAPPAPDQDSPLAEVVADEQTATPYEQLERHTLCQLLRESLGGLSAREIEVLRLRYGLDDTEELTLQEVGDRIGLTRERVRQIQEGAVRKLRRWISRREAIQVSA